MKIWLNFLCDFCHSFSLFLGVVFYVAYFKAQLTNGVDISFLQSILCCKWSPKITGLKQIWKFCDSKKITLSLSSFINGKQDFSTLKSSKLIAWGLDAKIADFWYCKHNLIRSLSHNNLVHYVNRELAAWNRLLFLWVGIRSYFTCWGASLG